MYHSVSMLLPDGRVLSAGGGRLAPAPDQLNMQMYSPGYLFKGPRPTSSSLPGHIAYGSTMDLVTPQAADIAKVTLVNLASVTHTADWNQHFMELPFTRNGDTLNVDTPANANLAPPNYYMVFAVDSNGVPSTAKIVKLGGARRPSDTTSPDRQHDRPGLRGNRLGLGDPDGDGGRQRRCRRRAVPVDGVAVGAEDTTSPYSVYLGLEQRGGRRPHHQRRRPGRRRQHHDVGTSHGHGLQRRPDQPRGGVLVQRGRGLHVRRLLGERQRRPCLPGGVGPGQVRHGPRRSTVRTTTGLSPTRPAST